MTLKSYLENRIRGWLPTEFKSLQVEEKKHRNIFRLDRASVGIVIALAVSMLSAVSQFLGGNAIFVLFLWFACVVGFGLVLNVLASRNTQMSMKLLLGAWFLVLSLGGALVNVYLFTVPAGLLVRTFSAVVFIAVHVPYIVAVTAYFVGKKELSGKLMGWFNSRS